MKGEPEHASHRYNNSIGHKFDCSRGNKGAGDHLVKWRAVLVLLRPKLGASPRGEAACTLDFSAGWPSLSRAESPNHWEKWLRACSRALKEDLGDGGLGGRAVVAAARRKKI